MDAKTSWPLSSIALVIAGILLVGTGVYFIFLRPPLLPEDVHYMALTAAQLEPVGLRLEQWLTHVFWMMGGYLLATGILAITLALTSFGKHSLQAAIGVPFGGAASIGWRRQLHDQLGFQMRAAGHGARVGKQPGLVLA